MTYRIAPGVHTRPMDDELVVLNERTGAFTGLNASATLIWHAIAGGGSRDDAIEALTEVYEVSDEAAAAAVDDLLRQLGELGIIEGPIASDARP